ncbi:unnamed protein product [Lymnaea stagnalis]|uniref:Protein kinase domain-containing protein n=1 Tax=Lymnaea stagnalis TaxID=6523 RepID=A0AAV2HIA7_LYMST
MSGRIPQTPEEVDAIPTLIQAVRIIGNLVDLPANTQLDEAKMIIKRLFDLIPPPSSRGPIVEREALAAAVNVDRGNRAYLRRLLARIGEYLQGLPQPYQDNLQMMFPNYKEQLSCYNEELNTPTCEILVAGETCSGKSSLINMLINKDLLPTGVLRCTSAVVEIKYGAVPEVYVYSKNGTGGSVPPRQVKSASSDGSEKTLQDELKRIITERDPTTDDSPFEKVVVFWPLECLQCGVTIVDSPGVCETAALSQTLANYLAKASGLIYVIDATSSMPKHRLVQLLLKASERREGFDPNTAIFVCNRWEAVRPEDSERVKASFVDRLSFIIPDFNGSQLYPISVKDNITRLNYGVVSSEYAALIEGIRQMLPRTMTGRLRIYYRYVAALLEKSRHSLRISLSVLTDSMETNKRRYKEVEAKMKKIKEQSDVLLKEIKKHVKIFSHQTAKELVCHLDSHEIRSKLAAGCDWTAVRQRRRWVKKAETANALIAEAVCDEVNEFERERRSVKEMLDEITAQFRRQFNLFEDQLNIVKDKLLEDDQLRIFVDVTRTTRTEKQGRKRTRVHYSIGAILVSRLDLDVRSVKTFKEDFKSDPARAMRQAVDTYLQQFTADTIAVYLEGFFKRLVTATDRVGSYIPNILEADQALLRVELDECRGKTDVITSADQKCGSLQGQLDQYFAVRLMETDFAERQLIVQNEIGRGQFASVCKATLRLESVDQQVAVKIPLNPLTVEDISYTILEDAVLRELKHENIIKYYGVYRTGAEQNMRLVFVMEYCEKTMMSLIVNTDPPSSYRRDTAEGQFMDTFFKVTDYLLQLCSGLEYLHHKSIAHRDLKPENILIAIKDGRETIKIADFGLAKKMFKPASSQVGSRAYMAPEIFHVGAKYDTKVDIYSLALIVWSLWYGTELVHFIERDISGSFDDAVKDGWRPSLTMAQPPPDSWRELIQKCWHRDPKERPSAWQVAIVLRSNPFEIFDE